MSGHQGKQHQHHLHTTPPEIAALHERITAELQPLLASRNVDAITVREICQRYLTVPTEASGKDAKPASSPRPSSDAEDDIMAPSFAGAGPSTYEDSKRPAHVSRTHINLPVLSVALRPRVWRVLLGTHNKDDSSLDNWTPQFDLDNQKIIRGDCDRTRPGQEEFEADNGRLRDELEVLLTFYCRSRGVVYKQGLNEIVAPFLVAFEGFSRGQILNCCYALIAKFLPSIFNDNEFESLQCIMRLFNLLLLYHDPVLANYLSQYLIEPEMYATPWFITLFARKSPLPVVFALWDLYIIEDDPFLPYFVALALLIRNRKFLLQKDQHSLHQALGSLAVDSLETVRRLVLRARLYRSRTPLSFRQRLYDISLNIKSPDAVRAFGDAIKRLPCIDVPAAEVVQHSYHDLLEDGSLQYILLDCRPKEQFDSGHLPTAIHMSPSLLEHPEEMARALDEFAAMKGCHFCLLPASAVGGARAEMVRSSSTGSSTSSSTVGPAGLTASASTGSLGGRETPPIVASSSREPSIRDDPSQHRPSYHEDVTSLFLVHFLQKGFPHVSRCEEGYAACHHLVVESGTELVDHHPQRCEVCSPAGVKSSRFGINLPSVQLPSVSAIGSHFMKRLKKLKTSLTPALSKGDPGVKTTGVAAGAPAKRSSMSNPSPAVQHKAPLLADDLGSQRDVAIDLSAWAPHDDVKFFACDRITKRADGVEKRSARLLAVTPSYVVCLERIAFSEPLTESSVAAGVMSPTAASAPAVHMFATDFPDQLRGFAFVKSKHRLADLEKITSSKKEPHLLTFYWKSLPEYEGKRLDSFMVENIRECVEAVKTGFLRAQQAQS